MLQGLIGRSGVLRDQAWMTGTWVPTTPTGTTAPSPSSKRRIAVEPCMRCPLGRSARTQRVQLQSGNALGSFNYLGRGLRATD